MTTSDIEYRIEKIFVDDVIKVKSKCTHYLIKISNNKKKKKKEKVRRNCNLNLNNIP